MLVSRNYMRFASFWWKILCNQQLYVKQIDVSIF